MMAARLIGAARMIQSGFVTVTGMAVSEDRSGAALHFLTFRG